MKNETIYLVYMSDYNDKSVEFACKHKIDAETYVREAIAGQKANGGRGFFWFIREIELVGGDV